ncbi:MAG: molybdopterin-dependent oxidoreductase, partial [Proteobacteria bacterium]|nr:molybdopterin-dependent oxidoreductase [Pseudomonadota bacterium]
ISVAQQNMVAELAAVAAAVYQLSGSSAPENISDAISKANVNAIISDRHKEIAQQLTDANSTTVLLGNIANMHPQMSALRALAEAIAKATNSTFGYLTDGCNAAGAWLAGAVPHRGAGGAIEDVVVGKNVSELNNEKLAACLLLNIEPDTDAADAKALMSTLNDADFVVSVSAYKSASVKQVADVMLPAANFMETSGTYVNAEGFWQSFKGVVEPKGGARPAWKVLRVLGNLTGVDGFEQMSSEDVKAEVRAQCESIELSNALNGSTAITIESASGLHRSSDVPMYATDAIVRRAGSLQKTIDAQSMCVRLNSAEADRLGVTAASSVTVTQGDNSAVLMLVIDETIPDSSAWIPLAVEGNEVLGSSFGVVSIAGAMSEGEQK